MGRSDFLYARFLANLSHTPTVCQDNLMRKVADFVSSDDDILVVNGYAGTGKTTAMASVITTLKEFQTKCVLLAPTGRAAKVLASYAGQQAFTIHKHIYRQKSVGGDGFGQFTLSPNKDKETLLDERKLTNIGVFRYYMDTWLTMCSGINTQMIHMVRQLEPGPTGIPIQIYCFSSDKQWLNYEKIQADIFDHIMAVLPEFGLKVFEYLSPLDGNFEEQP